MIDSSFPHAYDSVRDELRRRLAEAPVGLVQILVGPRQVGKTTLLLELERAWSGATFYAAGDSAAAALPGWWESLWSRAEAASAERPVLVLLDEVHYLPDWQGRLKATFDELKRRKLPIRIVATGSSALSVGRGSRESMAGRFERLRLLHWQAAAVARHFDTAPSIAAADVVRFGGYPGAVALQPDLNRWRAYIRDSIVEPAIGRDLMAIEPVRKPALLRQIFALATGHPAQILSLQKIRGQLRDPGALETIAHYLNLLEEACLVAAIPKYSGAIVRQRAAPPKLVPLSNALLSTVVDDPPPSTDDRPERWGRWVENACIAAAWNSGQTVHYWREEPLEVDVVTTGSWGRWALEIKTGRLTSQAFRGVLEFCRRNRDFRPAVVCDPGQERACVDAGVTGVAWQTFLLSGPPG